MSNHSLSLSDFSKGKLFEIMSQIEECVFAFFDQLDVDDELFELLQMLDTHRIAIPDNLMCSIESFIYEELDQLINNADNLLEKVTSGSRKWADIEEEFRDNHLNPFKCYIKPYLVTP